MPESVSAITEELVSSTQKEAVKAHEVLLVALGLGVLAVSSEGWSRLGGEGPATSAQIAPRTQAHLT